MTQVMDDKAEAKAAKAAIKARAADMEKREKALNEGKTGKGLRTMLGLTRGKNPTEVQYEAFDTTQSDTLPVTIDEFMSLTGSDKLSSTEYEKRLIGWAVDGFNEDSYTVASDPIAEFVEIGWNDEVRKRFRDTIRNYSNGAQVSIEDAVDLIKPGFAKAVAAAK